MTARAQGRDPLLHERNADALVLQARMHRERPQQDRLLRADGNG